VDELRAYLATRFPKFWLPDAFEQIDTIPRTSAGKFLKAALRDRFRGHYASAALAAAAAASPPV
jgi:fatty-acyl-CoA synthase